ncbi:hypothetical protein ACW9HQ_49605, partial [Nocardia gipuzkoensis]
DLTARHEIATISCPDGVETLFWGHTVTGPVVLAGGSEMHAGDRNWLRMWDPRDWRLLAETSTGFGSIPGCAVAPDGGVILPRGDQIQFLRPETP